MWLWAIIAAIFALICLSAFFSGSETALTAASRARMHQLEKAGDRRAGMVNRLLTAKQRLIGALLFGNNLVNIFASVLATSVFIQIFGEAGIVYATLLMTFLVLVFAEVLPKTWALTVPNRFAIAVAPFVRIAVAAFWPVVALVEWIVRGILRLIGAHAGADDLVSARDEIRGAVDLLHREGSVRKGDRDMLGGLLDLSVLDVSDIMVHRTNMQALNAGDPIGKIVDAAVASPFTRLPLWRDKPGNIVGVLHAKDLLHALAAAGGDSAKIDFMQVAA